MKFWQDMRMPPRVTNYAGGERRVGIELEFGAISAQDGASFVQELFGGSIKENDPHRYYIEGTEFGTFTSELDTQYAHRAYNDNGEKAVAKDSLEQFLVDFRNMMWRVYGNVSSLIVPCEIVCPPIALGKLLEVDKLVRKLNEAGAHGTRANPLYAFGAQFNPEIAERDVRWIVAVLKSYLLISDWLRSVMAIDATRRLVAFADPFPAEYIGKVVNPDYWPSQDDLIADYLLFNPTRNRELDMLPLFAWLDGDRVSQAISDPRIMPRPTFHYRLPDANLGTDGWTLALEWNRWAVVEHLAENPDILAPMADAYLQNRVRFVRQDWAVKASEWLVLT